MNAHLFKKLFVVGSVVVSFLFFAAFVQAESCPYSQGKQPKHPYLQGQGPHGGGGGQGFAFACLKGELSESDLEKLGKLRSTFQKESRDTKLEIMSKELAMKSELLKKDSDADTVLALQADISKLKADRDQRRVKHILEMKKINSYAGRCFLNKGAGKGAGGRGCGKGYQHL
ncbi:MAG: periplasmic heavy metal sensor [Deltaproteobacteria bacterium]|nr:periplasmic heavy metal sensor [Deltaproteobacteria bacterium]